MSAIQRILNVDAAIVGGGIAGLWLLARLRERGYGALLIESERLGAGQTICAQGIVHGGAKYSLHGQVSRSAEAVAGMPELWRRCLRVKTRSTCAARDCWPNTSICGRPVLPSRDWRRFSPAS